MERKAVALLIALATLSGCGVADKISARNDMKTSRDAYKQCLVSHSADPSACEAARLAYEADAQAYQSFTRGARFGNPVY